MPDASAWAYATFWETSRTGMGTSLSGRLGLNGRTSRLIAFLAAATLLPAGTALAAKKPALRVAADYKIRYAGIKIGSFQFKSKVAGRRYELTSNSNVKLLFGAFKWSSQSNTKGVVSRTPRPQSFDFVYYIKKKRKSASMKFKRGRVIDLNNTPRVNYTNNHVPLLPEHLIGVMDPMTAIMRMTRVANGNPCSQSAEIFDGKRRLRLKLSPKGRRRIEERKPSGQPRFGYVCRIRFTPIAGHKKTSRINSLSKNRDMEIVLRPVPAAKLMVPYEINIPTGFGTVSIVARSINIDNGAKQRIALRH
ncbi:MAG: DUF3108 domain-containing protein [Hyphomicrobiaceae bacterium]